MFRRFWKWLAAKYKGWRLAWKHPPEFHEVPEAIQGRLLVRCNRRIYSIWLLIILLPLSVAAGLGLLLVGSGRYVSALHDTVFIAPGILLVGVAIAMYVLTVTRRRKVIRRELARRPCWECGYSLIGLGEPRCPECGTPFDPTVYERIDAARGEADGETEGR